MANIPQFFWKRLAIFVGAAIAVFAAPFVLFTALDLATMDERIVLTNDTEQAYSIGNVVSSHDNGQFYLRSEGTIEPGETMKFDSGWDNTRCLVIDGQDVVFNEAFFTKNPSRNIAFKSVDDYTANISTLLTNAEASPCPYMDEIIGGPEGH